MENNNNIPVDNPSISDAPVQDAPVQDAPIQDAPIQETSAPNTPQEQYSQPQPSQPAQPGMQYAQPQYYSGQFQGQYAQPQVQYAQPQVQYGTPNQPYNPQYINPGYNAPPQNAPYQAPQYTPVNTNPYANSPYINRGPACPASVVYNNARVGNMPQYHYGNPMPGVILDQRYYEEQQEKARIRREKEKNIHSAGNMGGLMLIICELLSLAFSCLFFIPAISNFYDANFGNQGLLAILSSIIVVGGTFFLFHIYFKHARNKSNNTLRHTVFVNYSAPKGALKTTLLIFIGVGGCLAANFVSSIIMAIFYTFGLESTYTSVQEPSGLFEIIIMFIATAIVPPLVEEYSLRGVTMSYLSKNGNTFAILASAYMFGIFHGTAAQIPFAFICGLFFGYAVLATRSIWTGVLIHLINNSLSCVSSILIQEFDENAGSIFFYASTIAFIVLGIIALLIYIKLYKKEDSQLFKSEPDDLSLGKKFGKFVSSPAMIIATIMYALAALSTLQPVSLNS